MTMTLEEKHAFAQTDLAQLEARYAETPTDTFKYLRDCALRFEYELAWDLAHQMNALHGIEKYMIGVGPIASPSQIHADDMTAYALKNLIRTVAMSMAIPQEMLR